MKRCVVFILSCLVLLSCADHSFDKSKIRLPVMERHFNMETGEAIAEKSFSYDHNGNLLKEYYKALTPKVASYENIYEYDAQHNRVLALQRFIGDVETYSLTTFVYEGDKKREEQYYGSDVSAKRPHTKVLYYYSGSQADSSMTLQLVTHENDYRFGGAAYFQYDDQGRLTEEQRRWFDGSLSVVAINNYDAEMLKQTCNPVAAQEGVFNCTTYEYNNDKKVTRKYASLTGTIDRLLEEHSYSDGLLTESKIFDQKYYLPAYNADPTPYTLQIIYQY